MKYKGLSLEAEYYWRWLSDYEGSNVSGVPDINDHGYQLQASAMVVPKLRSGVFREFGDLRQVWRPVGGARRRQLVSGASSAASGSTPSSFTWITRRSGYTAYPMPVGAKGNVFHANLELNF